MNSFDPSLAVLVVLVLSAFVAGYIDTLVGGGGLITIPALMAAGLPPILALGTNKLQAVAGSATASLAMLRGNKIVFADVKWLMLAAFIGSLVGALLVQLIDASVLNIIIPLVLLFIGIYFILSPNQSLIERPPTLSKPAFGLTAVPSIGLYDGMFGPGTGSFFVWAGVSLRGQPIVLSTMVAKTLNFATNVAAVIVFVSLGKVVWMLGLTMMLGQVVGASLGARSLMTIAPTILRYLVITICFTILAWWGIR